MMVLDFSDLPDEGPIITGGFPRYHIGDKVEVNCTSSRSKPAAKLKWYINGELADQDLIKHFPVRKLIRCSNNFSYLLQITDQQNELSLFKITGEKIAN